MKQKGPPLNFRIFRVHTKLFQARGSPLGICFGIVKTLFFFHLVKQLFYSQSFIILCQSLFGSVRFFPKLSFGRRVHSRFHSGFRLEKSFFGTTRLIRTKSNIYFLKKKRFFVSSWGKCGFRDLCLSFGVIFGTEKLIKV